MKTLEYHRGGNWFDRLNNAVAIDPNYIGTIAFAVDDQGPYCPEASSLFYNGFLMLRLTFPFGVFLHVKPVRDARFQCGIGWALNGRFKLIFRRQTDAKAAAGAHENAPNIGQAVAWERGTA